MSTSGERLDNGAAVRQVGKKHSRARHEHRVAARFAGRVGAGVMEPGDAVRLVTAGAGHLVEAQIEAGHRFDGAKRIALGDIDLERFVDSIVIEQPKSEIVLRPAHTAGCHRNRGGREEFFVDHQAATVEIIDVAVGEQPSFEGLPVGQHQLAVDLVLHFRFLENGFGRVPLEYLQQILSVAAEIAPARSR
ncbi:hypothetical protein [Mesorhizobium sp. M1163]|uniref:hypothetical protein n=1 Tax=Mesorhizobium sp. M1163 TaxID=2957065 RepID=UPI0033363361